EKEYHKTLRPSELPGNVPQHCADGLVLSNNSGQHPVRSIVVHGGGDDTRTTTKAMNTTSVVLFMSCDFLSTSDATLFICFLLYRKEYTLRF
ncbi:hypothetical protein HID58_049316, partial [Brassica napus]